jgi:hypothetical protein
MMTPTCSTPTRSADLRTGQAIVAGVSMWVKSALVVTANSLTPTASAPRPAGTRRCTQGEGGIASGERDGAGSGVALDGAAALAIGADVKMVKVLKVLKVLNF